LAVDNADALQQSNVSLNPAHVDGKRILSVQAGEHVIAPRALNSMSNRAESLRFLPGTSVP